MNDDGCLYYSDCVKNIIYRHYNVLEAAIIAIPHAEGARYGDIIEPFFLDEVRMA